MKDRLCFLHAADAHDDPKIMKLVARKGHTGHSLFWWMNEYLRKEGRIPLSDVPMYAGKMVTSAKVLRSVIDTCIELNLYALEGDLFYAPSQARDVHAFEIKRDAARERARLSRERCAKRARTSQGARARTPNEDEDQDEDGDEDQNEDRRTQIPPGYLELAPRIQIQKDQASALLVNHFNGDKARMLRVAEQVSDWFRMKSYPTTQDGDAAIRWWLRCAMERSKGAKPLHEVGNELTKPNPKQAQEFEMIFEKRGEQMYARRVRVAPPKETSGVVSALVSSEFSKS